MAFEEIKCKGGLDMGMEGDRSLVAGRSQREKRRSYKDLLREEEEIAAQVRKSSKKRLKDSELFMLGGDSHKKKKKHGDDYYYKDHDGLGPPPHKKKHKSADRSPPVSSPLSSHPVDTAMGLLQAITSPLATGSDPSPHLHKKPSYPSFSSHSSKDRKRESGGKGSHSFSQSRSVSSSSSSKKHSSSSKSSLFHGGAAAAAAKEEPLTLREADGLKMKLIMSPEKEEAESFPFAPHSSKGAKKEKDRGKAPHSKSSKKKQQQQQQSREPLPVVGKEVEVEGHYGGGMGEESSSSGAELEAGELVIDDSYTHLSKKKKKSKKSKKKKDKEKDRDKEKSGKDKKHSKSFGDSSRSHGHSHPTVSHSAVGPMYAMGTPAHSHHQQASDGTTEKKKKKEERDREKHEKDKEKPKKKNTSAYQVFCKEYRVNINAEQPGLVFGELSKKLAEVWKAMPEKDKLVWRQKAQYLQHKQNKAEATTVKHKSVTETKSKASAIGTGVVSPSRAPAAVALSPARVPEVDPIDAAAHLQLLGESLSLIGHRLQETEGMVAVSGSLSVLLDSILCALGPLTCLTAQIPQLNGCPRNVLSNTLDNIAYIMPGL
ncbi:HMG domain-containing protein 4a [Nelusetta ayraudi]|uniref:HMG domain-containing protein 4a n=1 Tax=Nelusetta ayraudi TaxID=303726 RepID=UPI003F6F6BAA